LGIGSNIAKFRRNKGWTQAKLAKAARLSRGYIAAIEEGKGHPRIKTLAIIAEKLGVGIDELIEMEEGNEKYNK